MYQKLHAVILILFCLRVLLDLDVHTRTISKYLIDLTALVRATVICLDKESVRELLSRPGSTTPVILDNCSWLDMESLGPRRLSILQLYNRG